MNHGLASLRQDFEVDLHIGWRDQALRLFRPFDEKDTVAVELVAESGRFPLLFVVQTVQIEVAQV